MDKAALNLEDQKNKDVRLTYQEASNVKMLQNSRLSQKLQDARAR